jgi:hypothetical protein
MGVPHRSAVPPGRCGMAGTAPHLRCRRRRSRFRHYSTRCDRCLALSRPSVPDNKALQQTKPGGGFRSALACGAGWQLRCHLRRHCSTIGARPGAPASLLNAMSLSRPRGGSEFGSVVGTRPCSASASFVGSGPASSLSDVLGFGPLRRIRTHGGEQAKKQLFRASTCRPPACFVGGRHFRAVTPGSL